MAASRHLHLRRRVERQELLAAPTLLARSAGRVDAPEPRHPHQPVLFALLAFQAQSPPPDARRHRQSRWNSRAHVQSGRRQRQPHLRRLLPRPQRARRTRRPGQILRGRSGGRRSLQRAAHSRSARRRYRGRLSGPRPRHPRLCAQVRLQQSPHRLERRHRLRARRCHCRRRARPGKCSRRRHAQSLLFAGLHRRQPHPRRQSRHPLRNHRHHRPVSPSTRTLSTRCLQERSPTSPKKICSRAFAAA